MMEEYLYQNRLVRKKFILSFNPVLHIYRVMIHIPVVDHLLPVKNQLMNIYQEDFYQVKFCFLIFIEIKIFLFFFLVSSFVRRTASLSSNVSGASSINSTSGSSQISSSSSESLRTQCVCTGPEHRCKKNIFQRKEK